MKALLGLGLALLCAAPVGAQTLVELPCVSTLIASAHKDNNYGLGQLWVKVGNGINRMLVGCDLSAIAGRADDVVAASYRIRLHTANLTTDGTELALHREDGTRPAWVEGLGLFDALFYCSISQLRVPASNLGGPGATWKCPVDPDTRKGTLTPACDPAQGWAGGFPGHAPTPSAVMRAQGTIPRCSASMDCFFGAGGADCWRPIDWDVTGDVQAALADPVAPGVRWLLKRTVETGGGFFYAWPEEHAVCALGLPAVRPLLRVTLLGAPPSVIPDPLADGVRCALLLGG